MANLLKGLFGAHKPAAAPSPANEDADFVDYAGVPDPSPASIIPEAAHSIGAQTALPTSSSNLTYTKWYRVWERTSPRDFYQEALILPFIIIIVGLHAWGRRKNRRKAKSWIQAHAPVLDKEFAAVGFKRKQPEKGDEASTLNLENMNDLLRERTAQKFYTYATGRQNVAFVDINVTLFKRYNPMTLIVETLMSFFFESFSSPAERMEATAYTFDGKEKDLVPVPTSQEHEALDSRVKSTQSTYDAFVWAVVHKERMKQLRDERYDLSLTMTKDHAKLPTWATVMSESAEITDTLLTPDLLKAIDQAGDAFEYLITTDQPVEKPKTLNETTPRKRLQISLLLPPSTSPTAYAPTLPLFTYFLRLPDTLVSTAHFRAEVGRKIRATREDEMKKLKKVDSEEKAEERRLEEGKRKKEERERKLKGMGAEEQRKFLERERERGNRKMGKKMTVRG